jgi:hypothetical protein
MRNEKALIMLMRKIVNLLSDECKRNPEFSDRLGNLLFNLPPGKEFEKIVVKSQLPKNLPDIHLELQARGDTNFRLWLCDQPIPMLRAIIRSQDFDSTRRTTKWKEAEKLADFITDGLRARLSKGSAFIRGDIKE